MDSGALGAIGAWTLVSGNVGGTARSIVFMGSQTSSLFDDIKLTAPVPEPGTLLLLGTGLLGLVAYRRRTA